VQVSAKHQSGHLESVCVYVGIGTVPRAPTIHVQVASHRGHRGGSDLVSLVRLVAVGLQSISRAVHSYLWGVGVGV